MNGEDDIPVCLDACSDTWEEFFDNLGQEDQDEEDSDNEQPICLAEGCNRKRKRIV